MCGHMYKIYFFEPIMHVCSIYISYIMCTEVHMCMYVMYVHTQVCTPVCRAEVESNCSLYFGYVEDQKRKEEN